MKQNLINHIVMLFDGSGSMRGREKDLIAVADSQITWLAKRSTELDQETRVTVYVFDTDVECVIFDKDVLRLPSIKDLYWVRGMTALIDATLKSQLDLAQTAQMYGDHSFLTFVLTDGQENASRNKPDMLRAALGAQAENWTVAVLVPDIRGKLDAERFGFPKNNIAIWDTNSATGVAEAGEAIRQATDTYMTSRASGVRGSKTLFAGSAQQVNAQTVAAAGLTPLDPDKFFLFPAVPTGNMAIHIPKRTILKSRPEGLKHVELKEMIESTGRPYVLGTAFYELRKSEKISGNKRVAVVERATSKVYVGKQARALIGLGDHDSRIRPMPVDSSGHPPFQIYVESQSTNRLLELGSQVLLVP